MPAAAPAYSFVWSDIRSVAHWIIIIYEAQSHASQVRVFFLFFAFFISLCLLFYKLPFFSLNFLIISSPYTWNANIYYKMFKTSCDSNNFLRPFNNFVFAKMTDSSDGEVMDCPAAYFTFRHSFVALLVMVVSVWVAPLAKFEVPQN